MPGVIIKSSARSGPSSVVAPESARYFVPGVFRSGPLEPTVIRNMAQLVNVYGDRPSIPSAWDDLRTFFNEGGGEAVITRVTGPAATIGTVTLKDTAGVDTLRVDAASPGAYSSSVTLNISAGATPNTVRVDVLRDGELMERRDSLASPAAIAQTFTDSPLVRIVDLGSTTAPAGNLPAVGSFTLSAGTDDLAAITAKTYTDALDRFGAEYGDGAVAIPGQSAQVVGAALIAHAKGHRRIALLAPPKASTEVDVVSLAGSLIGADGEYAGLFYPWVTVPGEVTGTSLTISPEGYVAACRTRAHIEDGPWRAPAGEVAAARYVTDTETHVTTAEGERLNEAGVSAIRVIAGSVRLYGWRSLSPDVTNWSLLTGRDVVNRVTVDVERAMEPYVFRAIDSRGHLLASVEGTLIGIIEPIRQAGGLFPRITDDGTQVDPGYGVSVDADLNNLDAAGRNTIRAILALRIAPVGETIEVTVIKADVFAAV